MLFLGYFKSYSIVNRSMTISLIIFWRNIEMLEKVPPSLKIFQVDHEIKYSQLLIVCIKYRKIFE